MVKRPHPVPQGLGPDFVPSYSFSLRDALGAVRDGPRTMAGATHRGDLAQLRLLQVFGE